MDNNDSNLKPQQTGGLKLMTVFIAVLALHVVVIGGFTVYHLMSGGSTDSDLTTTDKTHKGSSPSDGTMADTSATDKSTTPTDVVTIPASAVPATTPAPDANASSTTSTTTPPASPSGTTTPASTPAPAPSSTSAPDVTTVANTTPAPAAQTTPVTPSVGTPASTLTVATPATATSAPNPATSEIASPGSQAPTGPIASTLLPPPEPAPMTAPAPALIPVPQSAPTPATSFASGPVHMPPAEKSPDMPHEHMKVYIVKITDSYKKIAQKHHITVAQLKEANHINGNVLHTGQKLMIPSGKSEIAERSQEKSATSSLAATPVVNGSASPMTTGLTSTTTTVAMTETHHHTYTVVKGDTLTKIAHHFKTTPSAIMAENGITDPTKLSIGKKLRIPSSEETRSARAVPVTPQPSQVQAKTGATTAQLANYGN